MIGFVKKYVPHETSWLKLIFLGIIFMIPFSVRYVFNTNVNYQTGAYSDFTSISLYLSDFFITPLLIFKIFKDRGLVTTWYILAIIWLIVEIFVQNGSSLQLFFTVRIATLLLFALVVSKLGNIKGFITWAIPVLGGIQAIIGIYQFITQSSLGLYRIGESHLSPETLGVAKIVAHGTKYIRAYGTFPHPNLLAGFLVISILLNLYLLTKNYQTKVKYIPLILLPLNVFGLFLTFSRAGFFAGLLSIVAFCLVLLSQRYYHVVKRVGLITLGSMLVSGAILWPYLITRATISDEAVVERGFYNEIGIKIIKGNPVFGVGPGISVLHMEQYSEKDLEPWQIQPIHNYYLITLAEWGIGGILLLLLIIVPIFRISLSSLKKIFTKTLDFWQLALALIGLSILFLFLFDHYFYTIWPTQLLLWLIIGLIINQNNKEPA